MRNSKRNGFIKSLTTVIAVVLMLALMLTGCTDKDAQSLANKAQSAADKAQTDANTANDNANGAQQDATDALAGLKDLKATVDTLPTDEAVAAAILDTLNKYVKGEEGKLTDESIVTYDELKKFLTSEDMTALLGKYATVAALEEKITGVNTSISNLDNKVTETLKGYYTKAEIDALKTELNNSIKAAADKAAKNTEDLGKVDARVKAIETWVEGAKTSLLSKDEFNTFKTTLDATIATLATKAELQQAVQDLNTALGNYATKTELGNLQTALNDLNTTLDGVKNALDTHKTAYETKVANIESWITDANDKLAKIDVNAGNITANANEILTLKDRVSALETAKTKLEGDVKTLTEDLAKLEEKVTKEVESKLAELEKKFGEEIKNLDQHIEGIYGKVSALNKTTEELKKTVELNRKALDDKINYVLEEIKKIASELDNAHKNELDAFAAATAYIAANDYKFDELLANYAAKESQYNKDVYAALVKTINESRIAFRRALTKDAAEEILNSTTGDAEAEMNLAQALYAAINGVYRVEGYLVIGAYAEVNDAMVLTDAKTSVADVEICEAILAEAVAQLSAEDYAKYINMYDPGEGEFVNLENAVNALRARITELEAIEAKVIADVHPAILAITGSATEDYFANQYADILLDMLAERGILESQVNTATTLIQQFKDANFADADDVNIERLVGSVDRIEAANARLSAIKVLIAEGEALSDGIDAFLAEKVIEGTNFYYYYDLEALEGHLADPITVWVNANIKANDDATVIDDFIASYNDLVAAVDYAEYIKTTYADTAEALKAKMDELIALNNVYSEENYAKKVQVIKDYTAWLMSGEFGLWIDSANHDYILGAERLEKYKAAYEAMEALHEAAIAVEAINEKIAALVEKMNKGELNIYTMTESIRPLRNEIVEWLNDGGIAVPEITDENRVLVGWITKTLETGDLDTVPYEVEADYIETNWALLDSEELITVINAYNALVKEIVDAAFAEGGVIELIEAIDADDAFILYQYAAIRAARYEYNAWVAKYNVGVPDFTAFDLGEDYEEERDLIVEHAQDLFGAEHLLDNTIVAAQNAYAAFKADLTTALSDEYKVGIMAAKIPASYKAAKAWVEKYTDERGFNEVIKSIKDILTEKEYNDITAKNTNYETLVTAAIADYSAFKALLDEIELGKYNVYMGANIQSYVFGGNNLFTTYANKVVGTMAKYGVTGEQTELLATFGSADMDDRFNTDVEGGINMVTVLTKVANLYGGSENDQSFLYYINGLIAEADAIVADFNATFTESYLFTIYSRKDIVDIRAAYDAWCVKAGMTNGLDAYEVAGMAAGIAAYEELLKDIIGAENTIKALEDEKIAETEALKKLIAGLDAIGGADKVTWLNAEQIKAAYAAYTTWVLGTDDMSAMSPNPVYGIQGKPWEQPIEAYNISEADINKLNAYYGAILAIADLADKVEDAIKDFEDGVTEDELNDAKDALEDLKEANGGKLNGAVDAEVVATIAAAEMQVTLAKALAEVDAIADLDKVAAPEQTETYANYVEWLKAELKVVCDETIADMFENAKVEAEFNGGNDDAYQAVADQLKGQFRIYLDAAKEAATATPAP